MAGWKSIGLMLLAFRCWVRGWATLFATHSPSHGMLMAITSYLLSLRAALAKTSALSSGRFMSVKFLRAESLLRKSDHMSRMLAK